MGNAPGNACCWHGSPITSSRSDQDGPHSKGRTLITRPAGVQPKRGLPSRWWLTGPREGGTALMVQRTENGRMRRVAAAPDAKVLHDRQTFGAPSPGTTVVAKPQ